MSISYGNFQPRLRLRINPSRSLLIYLLATHLAAVLSSWLLIEGGIHVPGLLVLCASCGSLYLHLYRYWRDGRSPSRSFAYHQAGWARFECDGRYWEGRLAPGRQFVSGRLVILDLKPLHCPVRWLILFADATDATSFRRLQVKLRLPQG